MAAPSWYYLDPDPALGPNVDRLRGPVELSELAELIRTGVLPDDEVLVSLDRENWQLPYEVPDILLALPLDRERIVREFLEYATAPEGEENWGWASHRMFDILRGAPDIAWEIVSQLIEVAPTDDALGFFAASPLEELISNHGPRVISRVEDRARSDPKFRRALRVMYRNQMTDEVWERVQRASADS